MEAEIWLVNETLRSGTGAQHERDVPSLGRLRYPPVLDAFLSLLLACRVIVGSV